MIQIEATGFQLTQQKYGSKEQSHPFLQFPAKA